MADSIQSLAKLLSLSDKALDNRRRKIRMSNPKDVEGQLLAWLRAAYEEHRDKVRRLGKAGGESEFWSGSMGASTRHLKGTLHQEPERITDVVEDEYSRNAWHTFDVLKGEELARKQTRSRLERLRQAEIQLRKQGKPAEHHIAQIETALEAMEREAKAA